MRFSGQAWWRLSGRVSQQFAAPSSLNLFQGQCTAWAFCLRRSHEASQCRRAPDARARAREQGKAHGNAEVLRCLVRGYSSLNETCQREMSRAVRLALWDFQKGGALTGVCDADVGTVCQARLLRKRGLAEHSLPCAAMLHMRCVWLPLLRSMRCVSCQSVHPVRKH